MKKCLSLSLVVLVVLFMAMPASAEMPVIAPKYVFMFIADGQGSPQISATQFYLGTLANPDAPVPMPAPLSFTDFPYTGIMTTYDATSFCPDSASTATSMASGEKTLSGVLNYDVDLAESFMIITEYAKEAGKKVGVLTSVSLDHATPAAYYAKAKSRNEYYDIALQGVTGTTIDLLGGGGFLQPTGKEKDQPGVVEMALANGFVLANDNEAIRAMSTNDARSLMILPDLDGSMGMQYEIDRVRKVADGQDSMSLAELTAQSIQVLDNDSGFFMMVEGGKIDWSGHANDAKTSIMETIAFSDAVQVAVDFAAAHPEDTLIIVTGDHETGGLTIGFATTAYETHFDYLINQDISFADFDAIISGLRDADVGFEDALMDIERHFGLTTTPDQPLTMTDSEIAKLREAFDMSMMDKDAREIGEAEQLAYGGYEPLSMALCHMLNNKAGIAYTSYAHTGLQIPVYAMGVGAENFSGSYDNTDIYKKTMAIMELAQ